MATNLYEDSGPDQSAAATTASSEQDPQAEERAEAAEGKTALIDSSICPGMKAGDDMVVHIEKVMGGEYLVSYSPEPGEGEAKGEGAAEEAAAPASGNPGSMYE